uniref:ferroxidase n=1 Tax=Takifugu rubripes TaxID=31033 RepID=H2UIU2_TAKRU
KVVFREYDKDFKQPKSRPPWLGLLGPTLRAEEGEIIVVTFRNLATKPYSIHPHGVAYGKQSEGANYFDNTSQKEKEDDVVWPNSEHVYYWEITSDVSPQQNDPTCLTYTYISHKDVVEDYNSGLIGALLVCKSGSLDESGRQIGIYHEYVFLFGVFNENESKFKQNDPASVDHIKYTINGFTEGSLPDVSICTYAPVSLHLVGMSSDPEVFSVHINGQVLQQNGHKMSSVGLISGSSTTVSMVAVHTGRWLLSSQIMKHIQGKMYGFVNMEICDGFKAPQRTLTREQRKNSREWTYYIAAEEIVWNYAPNEPAHIDQDYKLQYLRQSSTRIGGKYKKAVYTLYTNESFTEQVHKKQRKDELGILGPVIRAQIRDVIKIVFKNKATRPYSIYPHGLTIEKSEEGVNYPPGSNHSHSVQPGETHTYTWKVVEEDEPLDDDARCLTRLYHSAVDTPRDIASGLIGPLLICKSESLNVRNVQLRADKEQHAMFAVFDENMSWYLDDNIRYRCEHSKVNKADPDFYKSNVMHSINGYVFESSPVLGFCNGEVATWHVSSVGAQDYIQTATFYGHTFELNERTEDFLSLYPMTGETISMNMDNIGVWLLASLNSHGTTKGMRVKFQDVECYRDYQYEYDDSTNVEFNVWNPLSLDTIQENEKPILVENKNGEFDSYTEDLANELGLRLDVQNLTGADLLNQQINWNSTVMQNNSTLAFLNHSDPYRSNEDAKNLHLHQTRKYLENRDKDVRTYFIAAEEVQWDYAGQNIRHTKFIKVVFRLYLDSSFRTPEVRGEVDEHLGILGPVIKAEVGQTIMVVFKNNASRPFSLHPNGVSYSKQTEGLSYEDGSNYWYKYDNEVQPGATFTYIWNVNPMVGPTSDESNCRTWAYYSGVNPERDIHSGLIGPLLVCQKGTLNQELTNTREFMLLFMTFDESQSWYFDRNREIMLRRTINGIIYNLKGLRMYTNQLVSWHLINMGSPKDFNSVHFHGQTFLHKKKTTSYRQAVYPLLPGSFATLEMYPSKPGLWQLETEVGINQEKGMQTLFLVLADDCYHPLGLESGSVKDDQITAINTRGYWEPHLARLHNQGKYNAWSTDQNYSWIQVDFQRPVVISQVATQGAKQFFQAQYVSSYYISYSNDRRSWSFYKGDSRDDIKVFTGNNNPYDVKKNTFFPPLIGRFIRFHPLKWYNKATLRMDFYGCELDGCSVPLGMESGLIEDHQITASSTASKWYSGTWRPFLGRLNKEGTINAWQAKYNDMDQWLQVELTQVKKITGIVTQGAKFLGAEMFVTSFSLQYSHDGINWHPYTDDDGVPAKIFMGNTNNNDHVKNYMYPPIFSRFIRVIPKSWIGSITMRMELLGCDCE